MCVGRELLDPGLVCELGSVGEWISPMRKATDPVVPASLNRMDESIARIKSLSSPFADKPKL